jgi:DNA-binding transcriptional regulator YiaG
MSHIFHTVRIDSNFKIFYMKNITKESGVAKVTAQTMQPAHVKAARALLGWSAEELAELLPIGLATLRTFESGKDINLKSREAIFDTLNKHGIRMQNGGSPGVRITDPEKWAINLKRLSCTACNAPLPFIRTPANLRQLLWGGWTCKACGTEMTKSGKTLFRKEED